MFIRKNANGFTLIEFMMVVIVIMIVSTMGSYIYKNHAEEFETRTEETNPVPEEILEEPKTNPDDGKFMYGWKGANLQISFRIDPWVSGFQAFKQADELAKILLEVDNTSDFQRNATTFSGGRTTITYIPCEPDENTTISQTRFFFSPRPRFLNR